MKNAKIHVCWNDRYGNFDGALRRVEFGECVLETKFIDRGIKAAVEGSCVVLGGKNAERFIIKGHSCHVGNLLWDCLHMPATDAVRMINWLWLTKGWTFDMVSEPLFEAVHDNRPIMPSELRAAVD